MEKAKYTFYNIVPLSLVMGGGGHVVTHFADKVTYNQKVDALVQAAEIGGPPHPSKTNMPLTL